MILRISNDFQSNTRLLNFLSLSFQLLDSLLRLSTLSNSNSETFILETSNPYKCVEKSDQIDAKKKQSSFKERGLQGAILSTSLRPHFPSI